MKRLCAAGWLALIGAVALVSLLALGGPEPARADRPGYFAIRGARIVPVSGPVIESGTVVIANGLIAAVGANATIPPEAWVIDGKGLTVYPGLIDAMTSIGQPAAPAPRGAPGAGPQQPQPAQPGQRQAARSQGPEDRPGTTPWESGADELNPEDNKFTQWRNAGFTTIVSVPQRGILPGMGSVVNAAGEEKSEMVVKSPATLHVTMSSPGGFTGFPGSLMGTIAYIKQLLHDANQHSAAQAAYEKNPKQQRPIFDRAERSILHAMRAGYPVMLPANRSPEFARAIAIADEFQLKAVIYGAQEAYDAATTLAAKKYPVLVNLDWPQKQRDADPEAEESLATLRFRDRAPSSPAALQKAGVKFAFYSGGIAAPAEIIKNAKKAIDAGLPSDAAIRAFTLSAAEILGVADRLGSIEPGKIANLVVADGDIFNEKTKVKMIFVDGAKYEAREPARPTERPTVNLGGQWTLTIRSPQGEQPGSATLSMTPDGTLTGNVTTQLGTSAISSGWVSANRFNFTISLTVGGQSTDVVFSGTAEGNTMKGTVSFGGVSVEFTGTRPGSGGDASSEGGAL
ncbi:MAG: amidohydrolase family protein [Candidatus Acidiferrales bacterium]